MNQIEVTLEPDYREIARGKVYLSLDVTIDGLYPLQDDGEAFDIGELINSIKQDGIYFIWTCGCGVPGCAGYFKGISVKAQDGITIWRDMDLNKEYKFNTVELTTKINALHKEVLRYSSEADSIHAELKIWPSWTMKYLLPAIS